MNQAWLKGKLGALAAVMAVAAALYIGLVLWAGWGDVTGAAVRLGWIGLCAALALSSLNYFLRYLRWRLFLAELRVGIGWGEGLNIYLAGLALSATPGKVGEALRGAFLVPHGLPIARGAVLFVAERLSDLTAIMLICLPALGMISGFDGVVWAAGAALLLAYALLACAPALLGPPPTGTGPTPNARTKLAAVAHALRDPLLTLRRLLRPPLAAAGLALAVCAWSAEALALAYILARLGAALPTLAVFLVYMVGRLAGAVTLLPGGIGGTEVAMALLLAAQGVPQPIAVAATLLSRATTLWYSILLGLGALLVLRRRHDWMDGPAAPPAARRDDAMHDAAGPVPLCVDLDGTLIKGDSLLISLRALLWRRPWLVPLLPLWLIRGGKAGFKHGIAARVVPAAAALPYNAGILDWIRGESRSRPVVLATAAHHRIAGAVADHLGVFSRVVATDGENISGPAKAAALVALFGERGFDYAGNAREDLHVWAHARHAIVVDAPAAVEAAACAAGNVVRIYRADTCEHPAMPR